MIALIPRTPTIIMAHDTDKPLIYHMILLHSKEAL